MTYSEFINSVARRAGVSPGEATTLTCGTLETLAERITGSEARNVAAQLPRELRDYLSKPHEFAEPFGLTEFVSRVSVRADVDVETASVAIPAVLKTVCKDVTADEFKDLLAQLPKGWGFGELLEPVGPRAHVQQRPE